MEKKIDGWEEWYVHVQEQEIEKEERIGHGVSNVIFVHLALVNEWMGVWVTGGCFWWGGG